METKLLSQIFLLATGGATGTLLRYFTYLWADKYLVQHLPWGTVVVNLLGSFVIGISWGLMEKYFYPPAVGLFVLAGLLGSFTTFSTFALDSIKLLNQSGLWVFLMYIAIQNIGGILLCIAGLFLTRIL